MYVKTTATSKQSHFHLFLQSSAVYGVHAAREVKCARKCREEVSFFFLNDQHSQKSPNKWLQLVCCYSEVKPLHLDLHVLMSFVWLCIDLPQPSQLKSISHLIIGVLLLDDTLLHQQLVSDIWHSRALAILTHERAESHHSEKTLQEDPKGVHQGAVLAPPVIGIWCRCRRHRCIGKRHRGHPCSSWTSQCHLSVLGQHVDPACCSHGTEDLDVTN